MILHNFQFLPHIREEKEKSPRLEVISIDLSHKGTHFKKFKETVQKDILVCADSPMNDTRTDHAISKPCFYF